MPNIRHQSCTAKLRWVIDQDSILAVKNDSLPSPTFSTKDRNFNWHLEISKSGDSLDYVHVWLYCDSNADPDYESCSCASGVARTRVYRNNWLLLEAPKSQFRIISDRTTGNHPLISFTLRNIKQNPSKNKLTIECGLRYVVKELSQHESSNHSCDLESTYSYINGHSSDESTISSSSTATVESKPCSIHNVLLVARLRLLFDAIFTNNMPENQRHRIRETFENILEDIYTGKTSNLQESAFEVLSVAYKYDLTELKNVCEQVIL